MSEHLKDYDYAPGDCIEYTKVFEGDKGAIMCESCAEKNAYIENCLKESEEERRAQALLLAKSADREAKMFSLLTEMVELSDFWFINDPKDLALRLNSIYGRMKRLIDPAFGVRCFECGHEYDQKLNRCPKCEYPGK